MKKMLTLGLVLAMVMMFSVGVMADDPVPGVDDPNFEHGKGIFENYKPLVEPFFDKVQEVDEDHVTIVDLSPYAPDDFNDYTVGDQEGTVIIPAIANIPCYIELELVGNGGRTKFKSLGAGAMDTIDWNDSNDHWMLFDARMGGFVDGNWYSIDASDDATFSTVPNAYIQACDLWTANLYSNLDHELGVSADTLLNEDDDELTIQMRYSINGEAGWTDTGNLPVPAAEEVIGSFGALQNTSLTMQFRVPFNGTNAGSYTGDVYFRAYTI